MKRLSFRRKGLSLYLAVLVVLIGFPVAYLSSRHPGTAQAAWFDNSWGFRQRLDVSNASGSTQTNFQVQITYDTATSIAAGKMQSACQDIRFTDVTGKLLPYWIEPTTCNTSTTKIWVKAASIPTTGIPLYIYYSNPSVSAAPYTTSDVFVREVAGVSAAWAFDESSWTNDCLTNTVTDASGNGYQGRSCPATTGVATPSAGKFGNAPTFDGTSQYFKVPTATTLTIGNDMTLSAWVKATTLSQVPIVSNRDSGGGKMYLGMSSGLFFMYYTGASPASMTSVTAVNNGAWHHVVFVRSGTTSQMYIDGTLDKTLTQTGYIAKADIIQIGHDVANVTDYFPGSVDDLHIYNHALTAAEITDIYGAGGNNQGYTTTNYAGKELVRQYNTGVTTAAPATEEVGSGPILYWKLDDGTGTTAKDSSTNTVNGTLTNSPTWITEDQCISGKCLKFVGASSQYVTVANTSALNPTTAMSISLWIKRNSLGTRQIFIGKGDALSNATTQYWVELNTSNQLSFNLYSGTNSYILVATDKTITDTSSWHHVTVTWDGTTQRLYLDGQASAITVAFSGTLNSTSLNFSLGRVGSYAGLYFDGFIDEVKMYRYARSSVQVQADYIARGSVLGVSTQIGQASTAFLNQGLVGYWKMDEATWSGTLNEVVDSSGNGNHGTAQGPTGSKAYPGAGKFGNGGVFDGIDNYVNVPSTLASLFQPNKLTIAAWVNIPASTTGNHAIVGTNQYLLRANSSSIDWYADVGISLHTKSVTIPTGWQHIAVTQDYSSGGQMNMYLNGALIDTFTPTFTTRSWSSFNIGSYGGSWSFNGSMDDLRVYNRTLSADEVRQLYNFALGPVGYWKFDENTGSTVNDASGNANTGTWQGTLGSQWATGEYGGAGKFNGTDNYVSTTNSQGNPLAITLEAWFKTSNASGMKIVGLENNATGTSSSYADRALYMGADGKIYFDIYDTAHRLVSSLSTLNDGKWHHAVGTNNGTNSVLYIDGVVQGNTTTTSGGYGGYSTSYWRMGSYVGTGVGANLASGYFTGQIDDVRIYNYARTQQQIVEDMNGGHPTGGSPIGSQIGYWKFDEGQGITANNSGNSGSTLNGTLTNMASPANGTSGWQNSGCRNNRCLAFDGSSNFIDMGTNTSLEPTNITLSAWIKTTSTGTSTTANAIFDKTRGTSNGSAYLFDVGGRVNAHAGKLEFGMFVPSTWTTAYSNTSVNDGVWHHVLVTYDQINIKIYVDGKLDNTVAATISIPYNGTQHLFIGKYLSAGDTFFNGSIDEPKVYTSALTADQVRLDYNAGAALNYGTGASLEASLLSDGAGASPSAYWNFEEGAGGTVNDVSGNAHTGTWGGTGSSHWAPGKDGRAGKFNGTDDVVTTINNIGISGNAAFTIEAWLKTDTVSSSQGIQCALAFGNVGVALAGAGLCINFAPGGAGTSSFGAGGVSMEFAGGNGARLAAGTIVANQWYHIAAVKTAGAINTTTTIYINGIPQTLSTSSINTPNITDGTATLGKFGTASPFFIGQLDDVKIYNYARTQAQVAYDYNRGGPVGWWKFDECQGGTAHDSSGNNNSGTITIGGTGTQTSVGTCNTSGTAWGNGATGKFNASLNFDGTDDYVVTGSNLAVSGSSARTISAWIYPTSGTGSQAIFSTGSVNADQSSVLLYNQNTKDIYFSFDSDDWFTSNNVVPLNTWTFVSFVYSGGATSTSTVHIYVNGVNQTLTKAGLNSTPNTTASVAYIGRHINSSNFFTGRIDDVRVYNYALSASQVQTLYNGGAAVKYSP